MNEKVKFIASDKLLAKGDNRLQIDLFIWTGLLFTISFLYFFLFGDKLLFIQEEKSLFIFSGEYFHDFFLKPGGIIDYAGNFLTQGYFNRIYGSLVISISLLLFCKLFIRINKLLSGNRTFSFLLVLIPSCLLLLTMAREDHFMTETIGYLLTALFLLVAIKVRSRQINYLISALFPLFFYITGSFALLFLIAYFVYCASFINRIQELLSPVVMIVTAIITFYSFKEILFLQTSAHLVRSPLNILDINMLTWTKISLFWYMGLFPFIVKIYEGLQAKRGSSIFLKQLSLGLLLFSTLFFLGIQYDPLRKNDLQIEEFFYEQNWDAVIVQFEKIPSKDEISQYYYNLALTEKGQLCDRMFSCSQDYGIKSLVLPGKREFINRSYYFYYAIGLINEAHHLAYESMVINGYSSENLKMLIKTDIINGNYKIAERNINLLKQTLHYRSWAEKFTKFLFKPEIVLSDVELGDKIKLMPGKDFFIGPDDEENIDFVLMANPDNKRAFEYKMAFLMVKKDYRAVMYQVKRMKDMKYTRIPNHIEESMMIFIDQKDELPFLGDLKISRETEDRFSLFLTDLEMSKTKKKSEIEKYLENRWGNTFWFYNEFK